MCEMVIENGELKEYKGTEAVISVPEGVHTISCRAFAHCDSIQSIHLPEGLTSIGIGAFENCKALKEVFLPSTVTLIEDQPFVSCHSLERIQVAPENKYFRSRDGILFNHDCTTLLRYPPKKRDSEYAVSDGVQRIANGAFESCSNIAVLSLPESVTTLGTESFCYCEALRTVKMSKSITVIPYFAFSDCCSLAYIALPDGLKKIEEGAFSGTGLNFVRIPDMVEAVEFDAFADCPNLKSLNVGPHTMVDEHAVFIYGDD